MENALYLLKFDGEILGILLIVFVDRFNCDISYRMFIGTKVVKYHENNAVSYVLSNNVHIGNFIFSNSHFPLSKSLKFDSPFLLF